MSVPVAILAGGLATRLGPLAAVTPKALVDVAGQPFVAHQIDLLRAHGLTDIVMLVGHLGEVIRDAIGDGAARGVRIRYLFDGPTRLGTGGAIRRALPALGDAFVVLYGDAYLDCDYGAIERAFRASGKPGLMTIYQNNGRFDRSNVCCRAGKIARYDKQHLTPDMQHIDYGLGMFRREAFDHAPASESFDLAELYQHLLNADALAAYEVPERFYEIGSLDGLQQTRAHLSTKRSLPT